MHDLIHDLAQSIAGEICFRIEGDKKISKQARHLSYIANGCDGIKKFKGIWEAKHLRTFLPMRLSSDDGLRCLRVLSLKGYGIKVLLNFIRDLKHLRYLDFSNTYIKSLLESISTLYNLETLLLKRCWDLVKLPSEMENLVNLCHLDITNVNRLEGMPSNFGTLTNLQTLSNFIVGKGKGYQIRELKDLSNLKGQLCISRLENVTETKDAWTAKLLDKVGLNELELKWSRDFDNRTEVVEKKVLDLLQPSKMLKKLAIEGYYGATLAKWV
ncbi:hypothetical protein QQP08_004331 [Theobroma cacao]|nr:hypothetical protein QQP08_004331 [Theobroma cacao]